MGSNAASDAAKAQAKGASDASSVERQMYQDTSAREQPFVTAGTNALANIQNLLGIGPGGTGPTSPILSMLGLGPGGAGPGRIDPTAFYASPGYQYAQQEGQKAITNAAAARGGIGGNALKALQSASQGMANQNFGQFVNEAGGAWGDVMRQLMALAGSGQRGSEFLGDVGTRVAGQIGSNMIGAGNAQAGGIVGGTNALTKGISGAVDSLASYATGGMGGGGGGGGGGMSGLMSLFGGGGGGSYASVDPYGQSVAPNTWSARPDAYYLPGSPGYPG